MVLKTTKYFTDNYLIFVSVFPKFSLNLRMLMQQQGL